MYSDRTCHIAFIPSAQRPTPYDSHPRHIATGDFNQDGHLDLAVANSGSDNIGIFINHGNGTFLDQRSVPTGLGSRPYSVAVGHFDNDTKLDLAVAHYGMNSIDVYRGDGMGNFRHHISTTLNSARPILLVVADFNNDSFLDVAVVNNGTFTVMILTGHNNGSFGLHSTHSMGYDSNPVSMAVDDFNGDDRIDLVVVNYGTSELVVLLSDGHGGFLMDRYSTGSNSYPLSVAIGDLNNDKKLDLAPANFATGEIGVFLGYGNGTFGNYRTHWADYSSALQSIAISDMNNDTFLDIIVLNSGYSNIIVLGGDGHGGFSIMTYHTTESFANLLSMVVGDFDDDKKPDVALVNYATNDMRSLRSFSIYPYGRFDNYSPGNYCESHSVSVADFNRDGYLDVVIPDFQNHSIYIFSNNGKRNLEMTQTYPTDEDSYPYFVITGDVNNDYLLDIVVVSLGVHHIKIFRGNGDGSFKEGEVYSTDEISQPHMAALHDLNSDGNLDITVCNNRTANVAIFWGYGNGTFTNNISPLAEIDYHPQCFGVGDFNGDNILDIAVPNSNSNTLAILLGYGNGSFQHPLITTIGNTSIHCITIGDVNSDHQTDIVYTDYVFLHVGVLLGNGNGTFGPVTKYFVPRGSQPQHVTLGHYDNDTFLDIAVSSVVDRSVTVFMGIGDGSFGMRIKLSQGYFGFQPMFALFADLDRNNQQEIITVNYGYQSMSVIHVEYVADFLNESAYSTGSGPHPSSVVVQDLNNDGQSDLVIVNSGNDNIQLLSHYKQGVFIDKTIFSLDHGSNPQSVTIADFNKDHLLDIAIVSSETNHMNVFVQLKNGSFDTDNVYSTRPYSFASSIAAADLNQDGRMDLLIANRFGVLVFLAYDYVQFTSQIIEVSGVLPNPVYCITADFNNDDRLDIAVSVANLDQIVIYLGYGNGTFAEQISLSTGRTNVPMGLDVGHFNNDDYLDIVAAYSGSSGIGIFLGYGNGSFHSPMFYSTASHKNSSLRSVAVGDLNQDRRLDIVVANNFDHNVWIFFGHGNGSFTGQIVYTMLGTSCPQWVSIADLNNDTHLDLIIANNNPSSIYILSGRGNGRFEHTATLSTGESSNPYSIAVGDLNKDNTLDIVVINQNDSNIIMFFGDKNGNYLLQQTHPIPWSSQLTSIVLWDVNNDTILDVLVVDYDLSNSSIAIFYGYGDGSFTLPKIYPTGMNSYPISIAMGDFNNDSRIDLVMPYRDKGNIGVMVQLKSEPFASATMLITRELLSNPRSLTTAYFDNDDHLDLAVAYSGSNTIGIFRGFGDGFFDDQFTFSTGSNSSPIALAAGDFNNDHHIDLVVVNSASENIMILLGDGYGSFVNTTIYSTGIQSDPSAIAVAYLDGDSYLDVVVANRGTNNVLVFLGKGDGSLSKLRSYPMGYNARPQSVAIADMNNDHRLDIIVANYESDFVEILLQTC